MTLVKRSGRRNPYLGTNSRPKTTTSAKRVARIFDESPFRRSVDRVKACLGLWAFEDSKSDAESQKEIDNTLSHVKMWNENADDPSELRSEDPRGNRLKPFLPLADVARARYDLYPTSRLLAWLVGKIPFEFTHSQGEPLDFGVRMEGRPHSTPSTYARKRPLASTTGSLRSASRTRVHRISSSASVFPWR